MYRNQFHRICFHANIPFFLRQDENQGFWTFMFAFFKIILQ